MNKLLIWDFDGTLAVRSWGWSGALAALLRDDPAFQDCGPEKIRPFLLSGFPWHAPENLHIGMSPDDWWDELTPLFIRAFRGVGLDSPKAFQLAVKVRAQYLDLQAWQVYPDTIPVLSAFQSAGWRQVLLTNHVPELPLILEYLGLENCFDAIFNSAVTGIEKPNQKAFRLVKDWAGPELQAWMIGDNYTADYQGAQEAGIQAVLVRNSHPQAARACETLLGLSNFFDIQP